MKKSFVKILLICLVIIIFTPGLSYGYELGGDHSGNYQTNAYWPTNSNSFRQSPYDSFDRAPSLKFKFNPGSSVSYAPVIASDGTTYITSSGDVYALNPDGTQKWVLNGVGPSSHSVIGSDGTIYCIANGGRDIVAINADGTQKWRFAIGDHVNSGGSLAGLYALTLKGSLAIGTAGEIYAVGYCDTSHIISGGTTVRAMTYVLMALNPSGTYKGRTLLKLTPNLYEGTYLVSTNVTDTASPSVAGDGTVYVCLGTKLVGVKNGIIVKNDTAIDWVGFGYGHFSSSPVLMDGAIYTNLEGIQYFNSESRIWVSPPLQGNILKFIEDADHNYSEFIWETASRIMYPKDQLAVGTDKTLYGRAGMSYLDYSTGVPVSKFTDSCLYALNPDDGSVKWKFSVDKPLSGAPVVTRDGVVYAVSYESNRIYAVNPDGSEKWRLSINRPVNLAVGKDGMIYVNTSDGVYAYMAAKTVTFNTYGGSAVSTQNRFPGEVASRPSSPSKLGHTFIDWYTDDSYTTSFDFSGTAITEDRVIHAKWSINTYHLTYTSGPNGSLTGNTSQSAIYNTNGATVTAVPNTGYHFVNWSDGKTAASRTDLNVSGDINVTANFAINTYTLSYQASGGHGTFVGNANQTVEHGASGLEITAVPAAGYHFTGWSDGIETISRTDTNVTANKNTSAYFEINQYTLKYTTGAHGSITGLTSQSAIYNTNGTTVTAVPDEGYHFVKWSDDVMTASRTDMNVTGNINATANFAINTYTLTYQASGGHGSFIGGASQTVDHGSSGTAITAVPATGYHFVNWSDGIETISRTDGNITTDKTITANFEINQYTLNYSAGEHGSLAGSTSQAAIHGTDGSEVRALPDAWHHFVRWSDGITTVGRTDRNVSGNIDVTAIFAIDTYSLTYLIGDGTGTFSGSANQTVDHGASGTAITAVPAAGYHFVNWSDETETTSRNDGNITGNLSVTANFAVDAPTIQSTALGNTFVDITWSPVAGADGYKIYKRTESGTFGAPFATVDGSTLSCHFAGLTNGDKYYFAVVTVIDSDESSQSAEVSGIPRTVPGIPTSVAAVRGNRQAVITFDAPADNGGSPITNYVATSSPGGITAAGIGTTITVAGLTNGAIFTFTVEAVNAAGPGPESAESNPVTPYSSSGSSNNPNTAGANETKTDGNAVTATTTIRTVTDASGRATAAVTAQQVADSVKQVVEDTKQNADAATEFVIALDPARDASSYTTSIPQAGMNTIIDNQIDRLTISTPVATLTFDRNAMAGMSGEAGEIKIAIELAGTSSLSESIKETVGDRPVFNFNVSSGDSQISQFNGNVTVTVPYVPNADEDVNAIVIYYINSNGDAEIVKDCRYDPDTGTVVFSTNHFSKYAIGYHQVNFRDVPEKAWYRDAVSFLAARGITAGVGNDAFGSKANLTRGQFLVMVMRAYGVSLDDRAENNFADAGNTYYTEYLATAKYLGITKGIGNNRFAPNKNINRQEMITLLYNVLIEIGKMPNSTEGKKVADYSDANCIASWAAEPVSVLVKSGIISGSNGKINPLKSTNRAEMAQVLYNLLAK